jgi:hypothetical protein
MRKIYSPEDTFNFGKYSGERCDFIYTFHPNYFEVLVSNKKYEEFEFMFHYEKFRYLHTFPIPIKNSLEQEGFNSFGADGEDYTMREYLEKFTNLVDIHYTNPPENKIPYVFPESTLNILKERIERNTNAHK